MKDISSVPTFIKFVPVDGKFVVLANVMLVPDPPVPAVLSPRAPFKVDVCGFEASPLQEPNHQPKPGNCSAGPTA